MLCFNSIPCNNLSLYCLFSYNYSVYTSVLAINYLHQVDAVRQFLQVNLQGLSGIKLTLQQLPALNVEYRYPNYFICTVLNTDVQQTLRWVRVEGYPPLRIHNIRYAQPSFVQLTNSIERGVSYDSWVLVEENESRIGYLGAIGQVIHQINIEGYKTVAHGLVHVAIRQ